MKLILSILLLISILFQISLGNETWNGGVYNFGNATNWSNDTVPGPNDQVIIDADGSIVTSNLPVNVSSITLGGIDHSSNILILNNNNNTFVDGTITINSNSSLVAISTEITSSNIINSGDLTFNDDVVLQGSFLNNGSMIVTVGGQSTVSNLAINNGYIEVSNGSALSLNSGFTLGASSIINVLSQSTLNFVNGGGVISTNASITSKGTVTFKNNIINCNGGNILSDSLSFSKVNITMDDGSVLSSNNTVTFTSTTLILLNDTQVAFGPTSNVVSSLSTFYIDEQTYIEVLGGSLDFQNDAVYLTVDGQLNVLNNGTLSITGTSTLQDSSQIYCQSANFDTQVTQFTMSGSAKFIVSSSNFFANDSNFNLLDSTLLSFTNSEMETSTSNHTFSLNAILLLKDITNATLGAYSFADNSKAKISNSTIQLSNNFNFNDQSNLEIDQSTITFNDVVTFKDGSSLVATWSTINFAEYSTVQFSDNSSFETTSQTNVIIGSAVDFGILNSTNAVYTFSNTGVVFVNQFIVSNFTSSFTSNDQISFTNVDINSFGGETTISSTNFTLANTNITFSNGNIQIGFHNIDLVNSNVLFNSLSPNKQIFQSTPIQMDSLSSITSKVNYLLGANITGFGDFTSDGIFTLQGDGLSLSGNFVNNGEFYFVDNDVYISSFVQNSDSLEITNATLSVGSFLQKSNSMTSISSTVIATNSFIVQSGSLVFNNGLINGSVSLSGNTYGKGRVLGPVFNFGHIGANSSITTLSFSLFNQDSAGTTTLFVQNFDTYSSITVTGETTLAGTLIIILAQDIKTDNIPSSLKLITTSSQPIGKFDNVVFVLPQGSTKDDGCNKVSVTKDGVTATFGCTKPIISGSSSDNNTKPSDGKLKPGAVVGIILAILAAIALFGVVGFFLRKHLLNRRGIREPLLNRKELN